MLCPIVLERNNLKKKGELGCQSSFQRFPSPAGPTVRQHIHGEKCVVEERAAHSGQPEGERGAEGRERGRGQGKTYT